MKSPHELLKQSEDRLNVALAEYEAPPSSTLAHEFYELRLQSAIFNYDVSYDLVSLWKNDPSGFAEKVALKSIIHRLYEYDLLVRNHLVNRMLKLATDRDVSVDHEALKAARDRWMPQLKRIRSWSQLRNKAAGHYDNDVRLQVQHLRGIDRNEVTEAVQGFLSYNISLLLVLRDSGRGAAAA
ncbi:hypothetical protein [Paucibacter sp. KCTC 42545]|uniref:hypothetical protein n=1 Tax=Paucibacter sp. KCTC 42545 TaxID=1768242 RepID=UPI000733B5E5|nr:hypothetical protein [Paucibacter sp. KCTC 42545]ALT77978.1 hypothetical protein AT984_13110 [Paucibacter sp. KCTC 42545]